MVWEDYKIEDDYITLTKKEIEAVMNHYCSIADKFRSKENKKTVDLRDIFYSGKADAIRDILKMFEPLEG